MTRGGGDVGRRREQSERQWAWIVGSYQRQAENSYGCFELTSGSSQTNSRLGRYLRSLGTRREATIWGLVSSVSQRIILPERDDLQEPLPILLLLVVAKVQQEFPAASGKRGSIPRLLRLTGFQSTGEGDGHDEAQTGTANPTFCCATTARALRAALMACFH